MANWPASLPQTPLLEGYKDTPQDSVLRSDFDGYTKQRNRFTAVINDIEEHYYLTDDQYSVFRSFYKNDLSNGSSEFIKKDPVSGINQNYRFVKPYDPQRVGLGWVIIINLEKLT